MSGFRVKIFSRISRNFSREMGQFFSHLARNSKREKCAGLTESKSVELQKQHMEDPLLKTRPLE